MNDLDFELDNLDFERLIKDMMIRPIWHDRRAIRQKYASVFGIYTKEEIIIILMQDLLQQNIKHRTGYDIETVQRICNIVTLDEDFVKKYNERLCLEALKLKEDVNKEMLDEYTVDNG